MKSTGLSLGILVLLPALVLAGPNAGGVILVHPANLTYEGINECGRGSVPDSCGAVVSEIDNATSDSLKVWKVYAAFPPGSSPRLKGLTFGIDYDDSYGDSTGVVIRALGPCAQFELPMNGWPADSTGTSILFDTAQTGLMTECYWFAGYNYYGNPATFALIPHPEQGGYFVDDSKPGQMDPIADYGSLGFGMPGYVPSCNAATNPNSPQNNSPVLPNPGGDANNGPDTTYANVDTTFVIPPGDTVVVARQSERYVYLGNETLRIVAQNGICDINGTRYRPGPTHLRAMSPVADLRKFAHGIPMILQYVTEHPGDSLQVWNDAAEAWAATYRQLTLDIEQRYISLTTRNVPLSAIADSLLSQARSSPVVLQASFNSHSVAGCPELVLRLDNSSPYHLPLYGSDWHPHRETSSPMTAEEARRLFDLTGVYFRKHPWGPMTIEFRDGMLPHRKRAH